jgi:hypothetical protein
MRQWVLIASHKLSLVTTNNNTHQQYTGCALRSLSNVVVLTHPGDLLLMVTAVFIVLTSGNRREIQIPEREH